MEIKDGKINELIERVEKYRNDLSNSKFDSFDNREFEGVFKSAIEKDKENANIDDKDNVFINCEISRKEALNGCNKEIKYKIINKSEKKEINKITVKIPSNIKDGQKILIYNNGNYVQETGKRSHLIVEIKIK